MLQVNQQDTMLTASELARLLHVHINTVRRWDNSGILKAYRIGRRGDRRFSKEDVSHFLAANMEANPTTREGSVPGHNGNGNNGKGDKGEATHAGSAHSNNRP